MLKSLQDISGLFQEEEGSPEILFFNFFFHLHLFDYVSF